MKKISLIGLAICCFLIAGAQEDDNKKVTIFKTWIKLNNSPQIEKGILYEIGDSSIFVAESVYNPTLHEFRFNDIDLMKVRRGNSISRGIYRGAGIGFVSGIIASFSFVGDASVLTGPLYVMLGMTYGLVGAGFGALAGTIKDRIPIKYSYENFEKYRRNIQDYSFKHEMKDAGKRFEHRGYVGFSIGFSVAMDEFKKDIPDQHYREMKMTGSGVTLTAGYRFTDKVGINFMMRNNSYATNSDSDMLVYWNLDSFTLGPVISFPTDRKYHFDIIPAVGFASAYMYVGDEETYTGEGLAINLTSAFAYNLSKRWVTSFSAGYLSSKQQYKEGGSGFARDIDFKLGLAYKFGKRSL